MWLIRFSVPEHIRYHNAIPGSDPRSNLIFPTSPVHTIATLLVRNGGRQKQGNYGRANVPEIGETVDTQDSQVLLRVIVVGNLINVVVPSASGKKRPPVGKRFRPCRVHRWAPRRQFIWLTRGREELSSRSSPNLYDPRRTRRVTRQSPSS